MSTPINTVQTSPISAFSTLDQGTNYVTKNAPQVTPVAALRKQQTPLSNVSTITFQTPVLRKVNARPRNTQSSGFTTAIPALTTEKSTYEVGESSRRTKRSKRPKLQSRTPIVFNLDDDGQVRKVYDKYVGVSEDLDNKICIFTILLINFFVPFNLLTSGSASASSGDSNSKTPLDRNIMNEVKYILDGSSDLVKTFRRARDRYTEDNEQNIRIKLVAKRGKSGRQYTLPTADERINIFHPMYLPLQYPLLMPRAQDGTPFVERLSFHLEGEQPVVFDENSDLETVIHKPTVGASMFDAWMHMNETYPPARDLTYAEFPTKFVWNLKKRMWTHRKQKYAIGRIHNVPISAGLRMNDDEKKNVCLFFIEQLMRTRGTTLKRFPELPYPDDTYMSEFGL
ncbi:hypothetical protein CTI12_AA026920 [Artemisia annua]|uniref:Uncharacterized protein n=1 Tax=Artemisia annua TaxID=35608 RepID=A0A2U1QI24_ARTAN|nr:hypothetical protein CTI12_AA026920 [Artemisia annua]